MSETESADPIENVATFVEDAEGRSYVSWTDIEGDHFPPQAVVALTTDEIPPGIHDLIDHYQADIVDAMLDPGEGLVLNIEVPNPWKDAGTRTVRQHGNSLVLTLSREALDASDIGTEKVDLHARQGEIHVNRHDGGPRFPR